MPGLVLGFVFFFCFVCLIAPSVLCSVLFVWDGPSSRYAGCITFLLLLLLLLLFSASGVSVVEVVSGLLGGCITSG